VAILKKLSRQNPTLQILFRTAYREFLDIADSILHQKHVEIDCLNEWDSIQGKGFNFIHISELPPLPVFHYEGPPLDTLDSTSPTISQQVNNFPSVHKDNIEENGIPNISSATPSTPLVSTSTPNSPDAAEICELVTALNHPTAHTKNAVVYLNNIPFRLDSYLYLGNADFIMFANLAKIGFHNVYLSDANASWIYSIIQRSANNLLFLEFTFDVESINSEQPLDFASINFFRCIPKFLPNLHTLRISGYIPPSIFKHNDFQMPALEYLSLEGFGNPKNWIGLSSLHSFPHFPTLLCLTLSQHPFTSLSGLPHMSKLRYLTINNTYLTDLTALGDVSDFPDLLECDLRSNRFTHIDRQGITLQLQILHLAGNPIKNFDDCTVFEHIKNDPFALPPALANFYRQAWGLPYWTLPPPNLYYHLFPSILPQLRAPLDEET